MKSVLISTRPKWCGLIASGRKPIEVRKTRPKIETPFEAYIYCTKDKPYLYRIDDDNNFELTNTLRPKTYEYVKDYNEQNGKVIGEFVCDKISEIGFSPWSHGEYVSDIENLHKVSCLDFDEMFSYLGDGVGYGWHISDLKIYDKPKELSEFAVADKEAIRQCEYREQSYYAFTDTGYIKNGFYCKEKDDWCFGCKRKPLARAPQSWCYVEVYK